MTRILFFLFVLIGLLSCDLKALKSSKLKKQFTTFEDFAIRTKPILNREYIIFLSWYMDVYGNSYPEKVVQILPEGAIDPSYFLDDYLDILPASSDLLKAYILNPKYLNYPLLGLKANQVLEMNKWLSDRYNENCLIELGVYHFNPNQKDSDSFATEAYLVDQYEGDVRDDRIVNWKDGFFVPVFRLPFEEELAIFWAAEKPQNLIRPYPFSKKDFLWRWDQFYRFENKETKDLAFQLSKVIQLTQTAGEDFEPKKIASASMKKEEVLVETFYPAIEGVKELEDFSKYPFEEKDLYGQMGFTILGSDPLGKAIAVNGSLKSKVDQTTQNKVYWMTYSKVLAAPR